MANIGMAGRGSSCVRTWAASALAALPVPDWQPAALQLHKRTAAHGLRALSRRCQCPIGRQQQWGYIIVQPHMGCERSRSGTSARRPASKSKQCYRYTQSSSKPGYAWLTMHMPVCHRKSQNAHMVTPIGAQNAASCLAPLYTSHLW